MLNKILPKTATSPVMTHSYGYLNRIQYTKEISLGDALNGFLAPDKVFDGELLGIIADRPKVHGFLETFSQKFPAILDCKVIGLNGFGASAMAFETSGNKIMKLSYKNHFPNNRPAADFDIPVMFHGHSGDYFYYFEKKADVMQSIPENMKEQYEALKRSILSQGYDLVDFEPRQTGFIDKDNKFYLVDPQCAKLKPAARILQSAKDLLHFIVQGSRRDV